MNSKKPDDLDLSINNELAVKSALSVTHRRSRLLLQNWLLANIKKQKDADYRAALIKDCGVACGINVDLAGNWDRLAHSLAWTLARDHFLQAWFFEQSGFIDFDGDEEFEAVIVDVFGADFVGNRYIVPCELGENYEPIIYEAPF